MGIPGWMIELRAVYGFHDPELGFVADTGLKKEWNCQIVVKPDIIENKDEFHELTKQMSEAVRIKLIKP